MFRNFSSAIDALLAVQEAVESAGKSDYFNGGATCRGCAPLINLFQDNDQVVLTAEIPGVKKEEINLELKRNLLRVFGERDARPPKGAGVHRLERKRMKFDRMVKLPFAVDDEKIDAEYKNGVLKVALPRAEHDKPKNILING